MFFLYFCLFHSKWYRGWSLNFLCTASGLTHNRKTETETGNLSELHMERFPNTAFLLGMVVDFNPSTLEVEADASL